MKRPLHQKPVFCPTCGRRFGAEADVPLTVRSGSIEIEENGKRRPATLRDLIRLSTRISAIFCKPKEDGK